MFEILPKSHDNILGVKATGKVTAKDYEDVLIPRLDDLLNNNEKVRFLYLLSDGFEGFEAGAVWDDFKYGKEHMDKFERIAVVTDSKWLEWASDFSNKFIPGEMKTFHADQMDEAWAWLES